MFDYEGENDPNFDAESFEADNCVGKKLKDSGFCNLNFDWSSSGLSRSCQTCGNEEFVDEYWDSQRISMSEPEEGKILCSMTEFNGGRDENDLGYCSFDFNYGSGWAFSECDVCGTEVMATFDNSFYDDDDDDDESFEAMEDVIDRYDIDMYSLMTFMAFQDPTELSVVKQAIDEMGCDRDTVRWAINWWENAWGGVPEETLNYLGLNYDDYNAEEFESEFSKGDMLNLKKYIDYPLNWINQKIAPTNERKARKFEQKERGQIPTKREPEDFRQSIKTPTWFKAVQIGILGGVVGLMYYYKESGAIEEPEEPEEQKEE